MAPTTNLSSNPSARLARTCPEKPLSKVVGQWQLVKEISKSSLFCVYQARPMSAPKAWPADYIVKVLNDDWEDSPVAVELIRREAYIGRKVAHPHLVSILSANVSAAPYYIVMPYLEGATIRDVLSSRKYPLPVPHVLWLARQVSEGLGALHREGWIHADLKPSNLFVSPSGHTTLLDLGFARPLSRPGSVVERSFLGTYRYVAPELFTSTMRADKRSDIYSLGVTLYEMLTGRVPFPQQSQADLAKAHLQKPIPDPRKLAPQISNRVARLLRRMLAKEPLRRPQSTEELSNLLGELEIDSFGQRFTNTLSEMSDAQSQ